MKNCLFLVLALITLTLSACSLSLAEDITPPPGYQSPTIPPTTIANVTPESTASPTPGAAIHSTGVATGVGAVTGKIIPAPGGVLSAGTTISLHGFDPSPDGSPQETLTLDGQVNPDGTYIFENVEIPVGRIFMVEVGADGVYTQSDLAEVKEGITQVGLPLMTIYKTTSEYSGLVLEQAHIILDFSQKSSLLMYEILVLTNPTGKTVRVSTDGFSLPFIHTPTGATPMGIQATDDSAPLLAADDGFAIPPSEQSYGMIVLFLLPYNRKAALAQTFDLPSASVSVMAPQGVKLRGAGLVRGDTRSLGEQVYDVYTAPAMEAGAALELSISGSPGSGIASLNVQTGMIIGLGVIGLVLITIGVILFMRERRRGKNERRGDSSDDNPQALMDAIIALDDQFEAGGIGKKAYEKRRAELKERLKELV